MRPFDEEPDYSDVALLVASVREWPSDDFARDLDARVARRFEPDAAPPVKRTGRGRLVRWAAGPAVAVVAAAVAVVVVLSGGGSGGLSNGSISKHGLSRPPISRQLGLPSAANNTAATGSSGRSQSSTDTTATYGVSSSTNGAASAGTGQPQKLESLPTTQSATSAPVAPGSKQIRSAQISLTTPNQHVNQVASEVFGVVSAQHGSVLSSHITSATTNSGGGYATFSLSIPTSSLQTAMSQLSQLHFAALASSTAGSQNVSHQYNSDQRQLADATALRTSLLKQLQTAYTQSAIDSIKAQLKLAEQQINAWQSALGSLQHRISYSNVTVQINAGGLPFTPAAKHSSSFTIGRAGHDALRVLVVSAGVALIALAVALPIGLVAALLVWLWVWLRQRRREHALDAAS